MHFLLFSPVLLVSTLRFMTAYVIPGQFAAAFVRRMDQAIASEQRSAEMRRELRMRDDEVESE